MRSVVLRAMELDMRRQFSGATLASVDSLLAYYSDSAVYEHPGVGAIVRGKTALRTGMVRYLGSRPVSEMPALRITIGAGVAVVETAAAADPRDPSRSIPPTRRAVRVFEFDAHGLVRRIIDYPW
jgi:hypothetical protein